jgi:hypothetical protein
MQPSIRTDIRGEGRGGEGGEGGRERGGRGEGEGRGGRGEGRERGGEGDASARTYGRIRADAPCFIPGNFKKDAIVRPSRGRPRGHRPIVRPSENVRVTTMI